MLPAVGTVEVIGMIGIVLEDERLFINDCMAFLANVLAQAPGFLSIVAGAAKVPSRYQGGGEAIKCLLEF